MKRLGFATGAALLGIATGQPTSATRADSGWVSLFNGRDFTGLYVYVSGTGKVDPAGQTHFKVESDGSLSVKGSPGGYIGTIRQYSHYRLRLEYRWPEGTSGGANSGLLIHLDSAAIFSGFKQGGRPRSIEVNCRRDNNYPWSLWSAKNLGPYISTRVTSLPAGGAQGQYQADGLAWTNDPFKDPGRVISGDLQPNPERPAGQWNAGEAHLHGDSGVFILNGQVRTRGWSFRLPVQGGSGPGLPCTRGNIGLQSEGAFIAFRNFEIMELDSATGAPLHARKGCTDRKAPEYDPRAVWDDGSCRATGLAGRNGAGPRPVRTAAYAARYTRVQGCDLAGRSRGIRRAR